MGLELFKKEQIFFHAQNIGVEKRIIFEDEKDCKRFIDTINHYKSTTPPSRFAFRKRTRGEKAADPTPLVDIVAYCLMPNHFHLLLKENQTGGVSKFLSKVSNSYTKYYNSRHKRSGSLFKGRFKSAKIETSQLQDIARYIHLDPFVKKIVRNINNFPFSSYYEIKNQTSLISNPKSILSAYPDLEEFFRFTNNHEDYITNLEKIKKLTLD